MSKDIALIQARKRAGMSQIELADKLGVRNTTVSAWECGKTTIPADYRAALRDIFGSVEGFRFTEHEHKSAHAENALLHVREDAGLSQAQLADKIGVTVEMLIRWESSSRPIPSFYRHAIEEALGSIDGIKFSGQNGSAFSMLRRKAGYTQPEIAAMLRKSISVVSSWDTGRVLVPAVYKSKLKEIFGTVEGIDFSDWSSDTEFAVARKYAGVTQAQLAKVLGVSAQTISHWENGRTTIPAAYMPKIRSILGIAADSKSKRVERICPVCGKVFSAYLSDPNLTCSQVCRAVWMKERHTARSNQLGDAARQALREQDRSEQLKNGTEAAMRLPGGQRGETNREAKVWELVSPGGDTFVVTNLLHWCRENAWRFGMDESEASKVSHGFAAIAQSMRGLTKRPVKSYKGWRLNNLPHIPGLDPVMEQLSYPVFVKLHSLARKYPHTEAVAGLFARDVGCEESSGALDVLQMILDCADGGLPNIRGVSGYTREEFAEQYSLPLKSVTQWETDPKGMTAWAERMLAYVVIIDKMQRNEKQEAHQTE